MIIDKVLNNNVVVVRNENNVEQIVMGRGIAYKKQAGDGLDPSQIDKVFTLTDQEAVHKFQELIVSLPLEHIQVGEEIVRYAQTKMGKKLNEMVYISLVDHISSAMIRYRDNIQVSNFLLWDIKKFYKDEFSIGLEALDMIEERFNVRLSEDEAGFIALHIVNATINEENIRDVYHITKVMQEIANIVKYEFKVEFDDESVAYYRFVTHLKFFAQRLISGKTYEDNTDDELLEIVATKYRNSYNCVQKISAFIRKKYGYSLSSEESVYLTIHVERVIYKSKQ